MLSSHVNLCTVSIFRLKLISLKQFHQFQFCHQSLHIFLLPPCAFLIVLEYLFLWVLIHYSVKCNFTGINCVYFSLFSLLFHHPLSSYFTSFSASSSLYQPPRCRPSAVWSPCAATNMGRAAVPAWSASWNKWPGSARPALAIATHPAATTGGGEDGDAKQWSWILTSPLHPMASKIWAAVVTSSL